MEFFEVVKKRRSIRKYLPESVPEEVIHRAIQAAVLAPNSSNLQTWNFYWVRSPDKKAKLVQYCLNQSAARTAAELIVIVANPNLWKRSNPRMVEFVKKVKAPKLVIDYYEKLVPFTYAYGFLNIIGLFKYILYFCAGIFRPIPRGPSGLRSLQNVAVKSASLAAQNFVLSITAQGYATCMMEGYDEVRVKKLLKLPFAARVVMVISVGKESDRGTWGPQFRIPVEEVFHKV